MKFGMIGAGILSRALAGQAMLWRGIGTFVLEGKRVAALPHYQTEFGVAPLSLKNDGGAAR